MDPDTRDRLLGEAIERSKAFREQRENLEDSFLDSIPGARAAFDEAKWRDEGLYVSFESFLWPNLLLAFETSDASQLESVLQLIEDVLTRSGGEEVGLIRLTIIGPLFNDGVAGLAWPMLGPKARQALLENAMGRVQGSDFDEDQNAEYERRWRDAVELMGGVTAISLNDAYQLRESLLAEFPEPAGFFRSSFGNWDVHKYLNEDEYRRRFRELIDDLGDRSEWSSWLSRLREARQRLLADSTLRMPDA